MRVTMVRPRVVIGAIVGAAVVLSLGAGVAPHNRRVRSSPASGATLPASPSEIRLWFAEAPLLGFMSVEGPGGAVKMSAVSIAEDRSLIAKITQTLVLWPTWYSVYRLLFWTLGWGTGVMAQWAIAFVVWGTALRRSARHPRLDRQERLRRSGASDGESRDCDHVRWRLTGDSVSPCDASRSSGHGRMTCARIRSGVVAHPGHRRSIDVSRARRP